MGSTIVVSRFFKEGFSSYYQMPELPEQEVREIAEKFFETDGVDTKGVTNIREFLTDLDFSHGRDFFLTPRCVSELSHTVRPVFTS